MRFLLKTARSTSATLSSTKSLANNASETTMKAWGQQCSPNCGCILRFELNLSPLSNTTTSPTVVQASYHAKRIMTSQDNNGSMKPLMTSHASLAPRPIVTSCTCPTLHELSQQVVNYLPGKSIQTIRNEMNAGTVGVRSSIPFRYTVLKENVLPILKSDGKKWNISKDDGRNGNDESSGFNQTRKHHHCYDLVEESILSLLHERQIASRKDTTAECFSSTMGGYFALYGVSKNKRNPFEIDNEQDEQHDQQIGLMQRRSIHSEGNGWLRSMAPSSYFLFGEDNAAISTLNHLERAKDVLVTLLFGKVDGDQAGSSSEERPTTTYLQLLDMYGNSSTEEEMEDDMLDDWVNYVDQVRDQHSKTG